MGILFNHFKYFLFHKIGGHVGPQGGPVGIHGTRFGGFAWTNLSQKSGLRISWNQNHPEISLSGTPWTPWGPTSCPGRMFGALAGCWQPARGQHPAIGRGLNLG